MFRKIIDFYTIQNREPETLDKTQVMRYNVTGVKKNTLQTA